MSQKVRKLVSEPNQPDGVPSEEARYPRMGLPRRVRVKGMQGVDATVVVTVVQGTVWLSVSPPFTWEAIMEPGKVDEVIHVLGVARDEAKEIAAARSERAAPREVKAVVRAIGRGHV